MSNRSTKDKELRSETGNSLASGRAVVEVVDEAKSIVT